MLSQIIAKELTIVARRPFDSIGLNLVGLARQRTNHLLLTYKQVGAVVVQCIDSGERALAIGNKHVGGNGVILRELNLYLAGLVAIALLLRDDLYVVTIGRCGWGSEHALEHFFARGLLPFIEVLNLAVSPRQRVVEVGNKLLGINGQIALEFVFLALLLRGVFLLGLI